MASDLVTLFQQKMLIQEKMLNSLPNEMLLAVLDKLDVTELIGIRGVSRRWQSVIEDICRKKRSIVIVGKYDENGVEVPDVSDRFNGLVKFNKNLAILKVKFGDFGRSFMSTDFCALLMKLFHQIESLVILLKLNLNVTGTAQNFISLLKHWSATIVNLHLASLSYNLFSLPRSRLAELFDQIDNLTALKRLNALDVDGLKPTTYARLVHYSFHIDDLLEMGMAHLGTGCISLALAGYASLNELTQMHEINARLVKNITHLSLLTEEQALPFVCSNFMGLKMLDLNLSTTFDADTIAQLVRLSYLSQLHLKWFTIDLSTLALFNLPTLNSIQSLSLYYFTFQNDGDHRFDGDQFCRIVSRIFSNLQQLTIKHEDQFVCDGIALHLNHFGNLRKHVIVPI